MKKSTTTSKRTDGNRDCRGICFINCRSKFWFKALLGHGGERWGRLPGLCFYKTMCNYLRAYFLDWGVEPVAGIFVAGYWSDFVQAERNDLHK